MSHISRTRAGIAALAAALACAGPAAAQAPAPTPLPNTITVTGTGTVKPTPLNRKSDASIARAVRDARAAATPLAIADGRARAANLAGHAGLELGPLLAIAEGASAPFGFFGPFGGQDGTFGPGRFCGTVRTPVFRTTADGKRRRVGVRSRRTCRVPAQVSTSLGMTFATSATPPPA